MPGMPAALPSRAPPGSHPHPSPLPSRERVRVTLTPTLSLRERGKSPHPFDWAQDRLNLPLQMGEGRAPILTFPLGGKGQDLCSLFSCVAGLRLPGR